MAGLSAWLVRHDAKLWRRLDSNLEICRGEQRSTTVQQYCIADNTGPI
jgi:hypothetical protein